MTETADTERKVATAGRCTASQRGGRSATIACLVILLGVTSLTMSLGGPPSSSAIADEPPRRKLDPAAWGSDHVGRALPELLTGDECLFCHRKIGATWQSNGHQRTVRQAGGEPAALNALKSSAQGKTFAEQVELVLGGKRRLRFLRRGKGYGQLDLLSTSWSPPHGEAPGQLVAASTPHWQAKTFGRSCAGCHATGVDAQTGAFSALSLDCYVCHGEAPLEHTKDQKLVMFSKARKDEARVVVSACGQCHIRSGRSRSLATPYANNFVAGDNLFRDLLVDWSDKAVSALNPIDAHVLHNARDVVVFGKSDVTCLSCHRVHSADGDRHQSLPDNRLCETCHLPAQPKSKRRKYTVHSQVCGY